MFPQLPSIVDNLTSAGIIDFDAESYVKGVQPRYIGAPKNYLPFEQPLPAFQPPQYGLSSKSLQQPHKDELVHKTESTIPAWKKALTGLLIAGLVTAAVLKFRKGSTNATATITAASKTVSDKAKSAGNWIKDTFNKVFQRTPKVK